MGAGQEPAVYADPTRRAGQSPILKISLRARTGAAVSESPLMDKAEFHCSVTPEYLEQQSDPARDTYAYSYTVRITNAGTVAAQLIARHWIITNASGEVQEVKGLGVVGHQPFLKPGEHFEYTSWTQLDTPQGVMEGRFICVSEHAQVFDAPIAPFGLVRVQHLH